MCLGILSEEGPDRFFLPHLTTFIGNSTPPHSPAERSPRGWYHRTSMCSSPFPGALGFLESVCRQEVPAQLCKPAASRPAFAPAPPGPFKLKAGRIHQRAREFTRARAAASYFPVMAWKLHDFWGCCSLPTRDTHLHVTTRSATHVPQQGWHQMSR